MKRFIDTHRDAYGVEPICKVLPIVPSTDYRHAARVADPERRSARAKRDEALCGEIRRVWDDNFQVDGARKLRRALHRDGEQAARCSVERLMARMGLRGVVRGKAVKATIAEQDADCPLDHVKRQFPGEFRVERPNRLWVSDFTDVSTWQGFVDVAFVIDAYARRIVG